MALINVTAAEFEQTVSADGVVLVDMWAPWCGPCLRFAPVFEGAAEANEDVTFAKINFDENQELATQLEVSSIPTIMAFRDGVLLYREAGALSKPQLSSLISQLKEVDMEQVRAQVAANSGTDTKA